MCRSFICALLLALMGCAARPGGFPGAFVAPELLAVASTGEADAAGDIDPLELHLGPEPVRVPPPYRLRSGDELQIAILGEENQTLQTVPVGPDGRINYRDVYEVYASGRTPSELATALEERLKKIYRAPRVSIVVKKYQGHSVTVMGLIRNPGRYPVTNRTRLMDVIALAGGIPLFDPRSIGAGALEMADLSNARLLRGNKFVPVDFEALFSNRPYEVARNNVPLQADDRIFIPSAGRLENKIMVLGAVRRPGLYHYRKTVNFVEAVALAGGPSIGGWERMAFVVRGSLKKPEVIPINARHVVTGQSRNITLQPGDIVYFPKTPLKKWADVVDQIRPTIETMNLGDLIISR